MVRCVACKKLMSGNICEWQSKLRGKPVQITRQDVHKQMRCEGYVMRRVVEATVK